MKAQQHILFASAPGADLRAFARRLKELEYTVVLASSVELARHAIERDPKLALVVIDANVSATEAAPLAAFVKDRHERLPVLWIGPPAAFTMKPDAVLAADASLDTLAHRAKLLLIDDLYPASMVSCFVSACNVVLNSTFECSVESDEPTLSRSAMRTGTINALMLARSENTSAYLMLGASEDTLFALGQRIGAGASDGRRKIATDIAGELINQFLGRMTATSELLADLEIGLPYVFVGDNMAFYPPSPKPSLMFKMDIGIGELVVEFWFRTDRVPDPESEAVAEELADGGFMLL